MKKRVKKCYGQGFPLSPSPFILSVEILAEAIRNKSVRGIKIQDTECKESEKHASMPSGIFRDDKCHINFLVIIRKSIVIFA